MVPRISHPLQWLELVTQKLAIMKYLRLIIPLLLVVVLETTAQEVVATSGGSYSNAQVQLDFTVGELAIGTDESGAIILTQGFHQTYKFEVALSNSNLTADILIYPNPTQGNITIEMSKYGEEVNYRLHDIRGAEISSGTFKNTETLNLSQQPKGLLLLTLRDATRGLLKTFKIELK